MVFKNIIGVVLKTPENRKRIKFSFLLLLVYYIGLSIKIPWIKSQNNTLSSLNSFETAYDFIFSNFKAENYSIFALSLLSIFSTERIIEILPNNSRFKRKKYRFLINTFISVVYSILLIKGIQFRNTDYVYYWTITIFTLTISNLFLDYIITYTSKKGSFNGDTFFNLISFLPFLFFGLRTEFISGNYFNILLFIIFFYITILLSLIMMQGTRRIPLFVIGAQKREQTFFTIKVVTLEPLLLSFAFGGIIHSVLIGFGFTNFDFYPLRFNVLLFIIIYLVTYLYRAIKLNPKKIAYQLKNNRTIIPGVTPGAKTADFIDAIISRIIPAEVFFYFLLVSINIIFHHLFYISNILNSFIGTFFTFIIVFSIVEGFSKMNQAHIK